jgi:serine/threonine protein kinase
VGDASAGERILVFEFISSGSLYDRLHKNKDLTSPLSWAARMDIAFQVAVALQYLHEEANPPILHRDVKSANVLLEADNCAKLADFGLSKLGPKDNQFTITAIRGSYGYMDPQYVKTRRYSAKRDVSSFGVLLLELLTGLKSLHEETPLAEWTQSYRLSEGVDIFMAIVDPTVIDHINAMELQIMIKIANIFLRDIGEERSSIFNESDIQ